MFQSEREPASKKAKIAKAGPSIASPDTARGKKTKVVFLFFFPLPRILVPASWPDQTNIVAVFRSERVYLCSSVIQHSQEIPKALHLMAKSISELFKKLCDEVSITTSQIRFDSL